MTIDPSFFDLETWEKTEELGSADGPTCPYCRNLLSINHVNIPPFAKCPWCLQVFRWRTMRVNGLLTWWTRKEGGAA